MRMMPCATQCQCALRMQIGPNVELRCQKLVRAQERLRSTVELSMKSEHNLYLSCEDSPQRAFFF